LTIWDLVCNIVKHFGIIRYVLWKKLVLKQSGSVGLLLYVRKVTTVSAWDSFEPHSQV